MKNVGSIERYQTEKGIIDALLKISEIIKKTTHTDQQFKKTTGDGDKKHQNEYAYDEICNVPIPPPMRTLESYVSGFNKQYYSTAKNRRISHDYCARESSYKRPHYDTSSSLSENHHRKKSSRYYAKESNKRQGTKCQCRIAYDNNEYSTSDC
jgi:hypothetical protein